MVRGGIYAAGQQTVDISVRNNLIVENAATTFAGGVYIVNTTTVTMTDNVIAQIWMLLLQPVMFLSLLGLRSTTL